MFAYIRASIFEHTGAYALICIEFCLWLDQKMQLDVDMSPPAIILTFRLGLTQMTFDPDPCELWPRTLCVSRSNESWNHTFNLVKLTFDLDLQGWPLTLTQMTFDLDPSDPWPQGLPARQSNETWNRFFWPSDLDFWPMTLTLTFNLGDIHFHVVIKFHDPRFIGSWYMTFCLDSSLNFGQVTDRHTDIRNIMHKSPPCIRTGGLKNHIGQTKKLPENNSYLC